MIALLGVIGLSAPSLSEIAALGVGGGRNRPSLSSSSVVDGEQPIPRAPQERSMFQAKVLSQPHTLWALSNSATISPRASIGRLRSSNCLAGSTWPRFERCQLTILPRCRRHDSVRGSVP